MSDSPVSTTLPKFIICGASRSGTTWLVKALEKHPQIFMAQPIVPEPKFFHIDDLYAKGIDFYLKKYFIGVPEGVIAGEKDTYYMENPNIPARIHKHLPDAKLIFILREPGMRAWSNYQWSKMHGHEIEDFLEALKHEEQRELNLEESLRFVRPHAYASRGYYAEQLEGYLKYFPEEQICCLNFNDLVQRPKYFLEQAQEFLGIDIRPEDSDLGVVNMAAGEVESIPAEAREWLDDYYADKNEQLAKLLGPNFKMWDAQL